MLHGVAHRRGAGTSGTPAQPCNGTSGGPKALRAPRPLALPLPLIAAVGLLGTLAVLTHPSAKWLASLSPRLARRAPSLPSRRDGPERPGHAQQDHHGGEAGEGRREGEDRSSLLGTGAGNVQPAALHGAPAAGAGAQLKLEGSAELGEGRHGQELGGLASRPVPTPPLQAKNGTTALVSAGGVESGTTAPGSARDAREAEPLNAEDPLIRRSIVRPEELAQALGRMQAGRPVVGTISNLAFSDMLRNWFLNVRKAGMAGNALVAALDQQTHEFCQSHGMPSILLHSDLPSTNFRRSAKTFKEMGTMKTAFVACVLEAGWDLVMSDTDTVWMRDPSRFLAAASPLGVADIMVTSDSVSRKNDVARTVICATTPSAPDWMCSQQRDWREGGPEGPHSWFLAATPRGHESFGNAYSGSLNTGVVFFRATNATRRFALAWHEGMRTKGKSMGLERVWGDQHAFNELHRIRMFPIQVRIWSCSIEVFEPTDGSPINNRIFWSFNATVRLAVLPVAEFCNGHVFFVQKLHLRNKIAPYVVHNTFQFYYGPGKIARFRHFGLWLLDPPEYYTQGSFVSLRMAVPLWIQQIPAGPEKHVAAMQFYYEGLQNALAIAMILNRTLIFPSVTCYCDRHYLNLQVPCRGPGVDEDPPFECPLDHFVDVAFWTADAATMAYRPSNFLTLPQVPEEIKNSRRVVQVVPREQLQNAGGKALNSSAHTLVLPAQADDRDVIAQLTTAEAASIRVLHIDQPHDAFCRFHKDNMNAYFDWKAYRRFHIEWCCLPGFHPPRWPRYKGLTITIPKMVNRTIDSCKLLST